MHVEINDIRDGLATNDFWLSYLDAAMDEGSRIGIHVAIFAEPFLSLVLDGTKTVESRFSRNRCAPFGEVARGDVILIKEVAGPICGIALAKEAQFFALDSEPLDRIRAKYGNDICGDEEFWESRADAAFATLIELAETASILPVACDKRDRRGWVSLRSMQLSLAI